jgi:F-type H+-transporting ATPase subunit delta
MRGSSRSSAAAVEDAFTAKLDAATPEDTTGVTGVLGRAVDRVLGRAVDRSRLGEDLFAVTGALDGNIALRRAVADPSRPGDAKAGLVERLFGGKIGDDALDLVKVAAAQRWSEERDLTDTLESLAVAAVVAAAEKDGKADQMEDELFRFERIVAGNPGLRDALTDRRSEPEGKERLVTTLLEDKTSPETLRLVQQAVRSPRGRRFDRVLDSYLGIAATRRDQLAATVTTAVDLDADQRRRLAAALSNLYHGKNVHLNVVVDPGVIGGIRVQIGDDVVDGTILRRLEAAKRHLST